MSQTMGFGGRIVKESNDENAWSVPLSSHMVRRGDADFGITDMGLQEPRLEFLPTFSERIVLAVPADHQLVGRSRVEWDEIANERFISVWKGAPTRVLLDFELAKALHKAFQDLQHIIQHKKHSDDQRTRIHEPQE